MAELQGRQQQEVESKPAASLMSDADGAGGFVPG